LLASVLLVAPAVEALLEPPHARQARHARLARRIEETMNRAAVRIRPPAYRSDAAGAFFTDVPRSSYFRSGDA
jgi:hypothetical protein